jgi:hypothetical protein
LDEEDRHDDQEAERELERGYESAYEQERLELLEHWADFMQSKDYPRTRVGYDHWIDDQAWLERRRSDREERDRLAQLERDRLMRERRGQWEER